ncbi:MULTISPECIES: SURF1 family cytochrome oxidase biogenesis protein [unclassified Microbacterium]|uniref:SURF1 family protein n=1 Tax=unclassified Microbacterium TaxID=2609290 RepID=UPI002579D388|nr:MULTISPECIES: SURF1 family cytochrome oxidase biogenesis protein [unclassified Microbacterium]|tara:strand:+ start:1243 stop:2082 length:840 start_codon:yes stop_codon:yes gene_type:complete
MTTADPHPAPPEVFPPTLREVMLRPRWLGVLALCLVVAGVFAWLGQWQLSRAVDMQPLPEGVTEQVQPIDDVVQPGEYLPEPLVGQRVTVTGAFVPDDYIVVSSRYNDGVEGYWVTGQFRVATAEAPTSLAVAVGWAATEEEALAAAERLSEDAAARPDDAAALALTGRLISDEGPVPPPQSADPLTLTRMSPAALLSRWSDADGIDVYRPYLVSETASEPLQQITTRPPDQGSGVNWLNIFYAAEWAIFAGFAFYMWYRLARDAWEKEVEDLEDAAAA